MSFDLPGFHKWTDGSSASDTMNSIVYGDCLDVLSAIPSDSVALIHTSPPYNIARPYSEQADNRKPQEYWRFIEAAVREMKRVLHPGGSLFWQTGYTQNGMDSQSEIHPLDIETCDLFRQDPPVILWDRIIWHYFGGMAFKRKFTNRHETILWWVKPSSQGVQPVFNLDAVREQSREYDVRNNLWGRNPGNVWEIDRVAYGSLAQTSHISVYPEEITSRVVLAASNPGDVVLDPFAGSGTTPKIAKLLARKWIGIEISEEYARQAAIRVGFQAEGLPLTLASSIARAHVFNDKNVLIPTDSVDRACREWLSPEELAQARNQLAKAKRLAESREISKRAFWQQMDEAERAPRDSATPRIWEAAALLRADFKLLQAFNAAQRFRYALTAIEGLLSLLDEKPAHHVARMLATSEPATFALMDDGLVLANPGRTIKTYSPKRLHPVVSKLL